MNQMEELIIVMLLNNVFECRIAHRCDYQWLFHLVVEKTGIVDTEDTCMHLHVRI